MVNFLDVFAMLYWVEKNVQAWELSLLTCESPQVPNPYNSHITQRTTSRYACHRNILFENITITKNQYILLHKDKTVYTMGDLKMTQSQPESPSRSTEHNHEEVLTALIPDKNKSPPVNSPRTQATTENKSSKPPRVIRVHQDTSPRRLLISGVPANLTKDCLRCLRHSLNAEGIVHDNGVIEMSRKANLKDAVRVLDGWEFTPGLPVEIH